MPQPKRSTPAAAETSTHAPHVSTQLYRTVHMLKQTVLDGTATPATLVNGLTEAERMADALDHRRTHLDPTLGGKVG
jgi:hypothetical protein